MLHGTFRLLKSKDAARFVARQQRDPFVAMARRDGYVCRSAYKLTAMDDKHGILSGANTAVIDLGSSPGGWSQVIRKRVGSEVDLFGVDLLVMQARLPGVKFVQGDFSSLQVQRQLRSYFAQYDLVGHVDCVVSDMCPNRGPGDRGKSATLNENALLFATTMLRPGGNFVCKVLGGATEYPRVIEIAMAHFSSVHHEKPPACRNESDESFLVAKSRLETPRNVGQIAAIGRAAAPPTSGGSVRAHGGAGARSPHLRAMGNRVKPTPGAFGLDDWPGSARRPK